MPDALALMLLSFTIALVLFAVPAAALRVARLSFGGVSLFDRIALALDKLDGALYVLAFLSLLAVLVLA
ncbi:MAG TPA: hypothetical protein VG840_04620, partial [Casimicrobiaceae bacterium]|nr:hypothetical protein [Casimicrobiaceae bacterium]